jgi:hypothetical protein
MLTNSVTMFQGDPLLLNPRNILSITKNRDKQGIGTSGTMICCAGDDDHPYEVSESLTEVEIEFASCSLEA